MHAEFALSELDTYVLLMFYIFMQSCFLEVTVSPPGLMLFLQS